MITYYLLFFIPSLYSILKVSNDKKKSLIFCLSFSFLCILVFGSRYKIGGDWINYLYIYNNINDYFDPLSLNFLQSDYLYDLINYILFNNNLSFTFSNFINQFIFIMGLFFYAKKQLQPSMIYVIAIPYLIIVVSTGYIRQASALGIIFFALPFLFNGKFVKFSLLIFIASFFHKTAFLLLFILPLVRFKFTNLLNLNKLNINIIIFILASIPIIYLTYYLFLQFQYNHILRYYVGHEMHFISTGASFRVSFFLLSAILCIIFHQKLNVGIYEKNFYLALSVLTILFSLFVFNFSSAVDRFLIYFYPLQLFILSRLHIFFSDNAHRIFYNIIIISVYFILLYIWANYGKFSNHWIPFNSIFF